MQADSRKCGANLNCLPNCVNPKARAHVHRVVHSMRVKAAAWQQSSSQEFHLMAQIPNVLEETERNTSHQLRLPFFLDHQWTIQSPHAPR
jgi:hypothetical protein